MDFLPVFFEYAIKTAIRGSTLEVSGILIGLVGVYFSLQNESIYTDELTDELTGIFNRAYLEHLQDKIRSKGVVLYGVMIDINNFKSINDQYNHKEGDEVLKRVAILLMQGVSSFGSTIHFDGDEFIAILNTTKEEEVKACIERVDRLLEEEKKIFKKPYDISVAYGYDKYDSEKMSFDAFMKHIDEEMYAAKAQYYGNHPEKDRRSSSRE